MLIIAAPQINIKPKPNVPFAVLSQINMAPDRYLVP